jgi:hypothetical protein
MGVSTESGIDRVPSISKIRPANYCYPVAAPTPRGDPGPLSVLSSSPNQALLMLLLPRSNIYLLHAIRFTTLPEPAILTNG